MFFVMLLVVGISVAVLGGILACFFGLYEIPLGVVCLGVALAFFGLIGLVLNGPNHFADKCHAQGGHLVAVDRMHICLDQNNVYLGKGN